MAEPSRSPDVAVIGGGIVGVCTALQLRRTGRSVMLLERGAIGDAASGHNGGLLSGDCLPTGLPHVIRSLPRLLSDPLSPLAIRWRSVPGLTPWLTRFALASRTSRVEGIAAALGALMSHAADAYRPLIAGTELESFASPSGMLFCYANADAFAAARLGLRLRARNGVSHQVLDADAVAARFPSLAGRFLRAIHLDRALYTDDPAAFTRRLADQFAAEGGTVRFCDVHGFRLRGRRVEALRVTTGAGAAEVRAGAVVVCAGPWSRRLARRLGTRLPLHVERGYGIDLPDPGFELEVPIVVADRSVALSPFRDGGIRISGIDELAGVAAPANLRLADRVRAGAAMVFPELRTEGGTTWMRARPSLPDSLPVIGRAPGRDNAYFAFGHGHKGFGTAAITARLIHEVMDDAQPTVDLTPFRPSRFAVRAPRT
ncbi:MAG TPA: FAD-binding oxidoreductase [Streptosporangiaceae bacterium]|nr:FAD-binding oxidoreductase [Streptosporangiaceae bacterium]